MMTGQKVVCINDQFPLGIEKLYVALPKAGVTYVVRDVTLGPLEDERVSEKSEKHDVELV